MKSLGLKDVYNTNDPAHHAIDLDYLRQHSFGNRSLEHEMLELFLRQSMRLMLELNETLEPQQWRDYARTLKASSISVGAMEVAELAGQLEGRTKSRESKTTLHMLETLETAILRVNDAIRLHLRRNVN